jgi:hypothetical protein
MNNIQQQNMPRYDQTGTRQRLLDLVHEQVGIKPFTQNSEKLVEQMAELAAETKQELVDIINVVIEVLIQQQCFIRYIKRIFKAGVLSEQTLTISDEGVPAR